MRSKSRSVSTYQQLVFLPETLHERVAKVTWSYSRRSLLEQCPRRYYYTYFGAAVGTALAEPLKTELRHLKTLANRHERTGTLLHAGIANYFRRTQEGKPMRDEELTNWVLRLFRRDCAYSKAYVKGQREPEGAYQPVLLREYYFQQDDADHLLAESTQQLLSAINAFLTAPAFETFRVAGTRPDTFIEHRLQLPGFPCKVDGRLDLAYKGNDQITLVDWKSGESDGSGNDSLQLVAYGLWATDYYHVQSDALRISKAFLRTEDTVDFAVTPQLLAQARARIIQDAERMAQVQDYGEQAVAEAFTPCGHPAVCHLCPFQSACPEGRRWLHA